MLNKCLLYVWLLVLPNPIQWRCIFSNGFNLSSEVLFFVLQFYTDMLSGHTTRTVPLSNILEIKSKELQTDKIMREYSISFKRDS